MERALSECYAEVDVQRMMSQLIGEFGKSETDGQAQWRKTRDAVLRRRTEAEQMEKAEQVEAEMVLKYVRPRRAKYVKEWAERAYGERDEQAERRAGR